MITTILSLLLLIIFLVLGGFHFYWLLGGTWGLKKVIPTKKNEPNNLKIPKIATLIVGVILIFFGLVYFIKSKVINVSNPSWITNYMYWFIPFIFILRAIGEFNYVGFFKKIRDTEFSKADSKIFSPLCLIIGIVGVIIQFAN